MGRYSLIIPFIVLAMIAGAYYFGRKTAPVTDDKILADSLKALQSEIKASERRLKTALDSVTHYKIMAHTWFNVAQDAQKQKQANRKKFKDEIQRIDTLSDPELDSLLWAIFPAK